MSDDTLLSQWAPTSLSPSPVVRSILQKPLATPPTRWFMCNKPDACLAYALKHVCMCHLSRFPSPSLTRREHTLSGNTLSARLSAIERTLLCPVQLQLTWPSVALRWLAKPSTFVNGDVVYSSEGYTQFRFERFFQHPCQCLFQPGQRRVHCCWFASHQGSFRGDE